MKTVVEIEWDEPEEQAWLCADNISIALHSYCKNTKFKVTSLDVLKLSDNNARVEISQALARGYCHKNNSAKGLDPILIDSMVEELVKLSPIA